MKTLRKAVAALVASVALGGGAVALTASPAAAHSFGAQGPAHTHVGSCSFSGTIDPKQVFGSTCVRYILANGAIIQASKAYMDSQYGYVLVWCSFGYTTGTGAQRWFANSTPYGPWGNTWTHTYCQNPKYTDDGVPNTPWSITTP